ncbi:DUF4142 domain-containing protein [Xanthobacteraceae bacterium A53D]
MSAAPAGQSPAALAAAAPVPSTQAFVQTAAVANQFEIVSSKLALKISKNKQVLALAKKMVEDHTKIGKGFVAALGKADTGITPPADLPADLQQTLARLQSKTGAAFDADYIAVQTKGHQDAVGLFGGYARGGENAVMRAFAKKALPTIEMHLDMCYALAPKP